MIVNAMSEVGEVAVDPEWVAVPPTIPIGFVSSREWCLSESDAFHLTLGGPHLLDGVSRRNRIEDLDANSLAATDDRAVRILPHAMGSADDDGQDRTAELLGDPEGTRVEGSLDAKDAPLWEDHEAFVPIERRLCTSQQGSESGRARTCGDAGLSRGREVGAEESPSEQLITSSEREMKGDACDDERVDESLVQRDDHILLAGIEAVETRHRNVDSERPNHDGGPDPLKSVKQSAPTEPSGGEDHPPEGSEEECGRSGQAKPRLEVANPGGAAREWNRVSTFGGHRNENGAGGSSIPAGEAVGD
jgi:hypothetical protein